MYRIVVAVLLSLTLVGCGISSTSNKPDRRRIGIVVPIAHKALDEMVAGFRREISAHYGEQVTLDVRNAHGDDAIQRSIINTFDRQGYDLIVPIGTDVTLMTLSRVSESQRVLALDVYGKAMPSRSNLAGVMEATFEPTIDFIVEAAPQIGKIAMIYSAGDKPYEQARDAMAYAKTKGIESQGLMISKLSDLYVMAQRIESDVDAIVILKDHVVASGIATLTQVAAQREIPLYTSDEGTVLDGATLALGNSEGEIGVDGARKAIAILEGKMPGQIGVTPLEERSLYINTKVNSASFGKFTELEGTAVRHGYLVKRVSAEQGGES